MVCEDGEAMLMSEDVVDGRREGGIGQERAREKVCVREVSAVRTERRVRSWEMGGWL